MDYFKSLAPKPEFTDPEEPKPYKEPEYSPVIGNKDSLIRKHFAGLVIGSGVIGDTISTLDPTGATAVVGSFMKGDTGGAVVAGVFALPNLFGVNRTALTSGEFLIGKLGNAQVGAQFSRTGNTLTADIIGVYGPRQEGLGTTTRKLFASIMGFAKEEGLKEVKISGVAIINKKLEEKLIKDGWALTKVKVGDEMATAYTKTFQVK